MRGPLSRPDVPDGQRWVTHATQMITLALASPLQGRNQRGERLQVLGGDVRLDLGDLLCKQWGVIPSRSRKEGQLHATRGADPGVSISPRRGDRRRHLLSAGDDEPPRKRVAIGHLEREPDGAGYPLTRLDPVDRGRLRVVQQLERCSSGFEEDDSPGVRTPVRYLLQPKRVSVEGDRTIEVGYRQGDPQLCYLWHVVLPSSIGWRLAERSTKDATLQAFRRSQWTHRRTSTNSSPLAEDRDSGVERVAVRRVSEQTADRL